MSGRSTEGSAMVLSVATSASLAIFCLTLVGLAATNARLVGTQEIAVRAQYAAQSGVQDAMDWVNGNPTETSCLSGLKSLADDRGLVVGEYEYAVADAPVLSTAGRQFDVTAYVPSQSVAQHTRRLRAYAVWSGTRFDLVSCHTP